MTPQGRDPRGLHAPDASSGHHDSLSHRGRPDSQPVFISALGVRRATQGASRPHAGKTFVAADTGTDFPPFSLSRLCGKIRLSQEWPPQRHKIGFALFQHAVGKIGVAEPAHGDLILCFSSGEI